VRNSGGDFSSLGLSGGTDDGSMSFQGSLRDNVKSARCVGITHENTWWNGTELLVLLVFYDQCVWSGNIFTGKDIPFR
jgi:hypothetical protein